MGSEYWKALLLPNGNYKCPWCERDLVSKKVQKDNGKGNLGRFFVSCSKDHEGCGLFCFLDEKPNDKFKPKSGFKRGRDDAVATSAAPGFVGGTNLVGPLMNRPDTHEVRLAELATEIAQLRTVIQGQQQHIAQIAEYVKQVNE